MNRPASFYQRPLPDGLVAFSSAEGRALFREALASGHMESFFALAEQFHTQADPAFCGLGSLVVVLNALGIDPGRSWKGPWRWFSEELLDCCAPLDDVRAKGLTLEELACLARCNGAEVDTVRALASSEVAFREAIASSTTTPRAPLVIASYSRKVLEQTGDGHFSPVGGYHPEKDLVLLLDVARFKYPPHWVPLTKLFAATRTIDPASQASRGWLVLRPREMPRAVVFGLSGTTHVARVVGRARTELAAAIGAAKSPVDVIAAFAESAREIAQLVDVRVHPAAPEGAAAEVLAALRATELHAAIAKVLGAPSSAPGPADVTAALAVALPDDTWSPLSPAVRSHVTSLLARARAVPSLATETATLREQLASIASLAACRPHAAGAEG